MEDCIPFEVLYERRCSNFVYVTPFGLRELMSDITREVLRCQPNEVYSFIASYLETLLVTRENMRVACGLAQNIVESSVVVAQLLEQLEITTEKAIMAAKIIQKAFRKFLHKKHGILEDQEIDPNVLLKKLLHRCNITFEQADVAAQIIQRAFRVYLSRSKKSRKICKKIEWTRATRNTINVLKKYERSHCEREKAATIIKAAYKGYYTRRMLKDKWKKKMQNIDNSKITERISKDTFSVKRSKYFVGMKSEYIEDPEHEKYDFDEILMQHRIQAAVTIQRAFRNYLKRNETSQIDDDFGKYNVVRKESEMSKPKIILEKANYYHLLMETTDRINNLFEMENK